MNMNVTSVFASIAVYFLFYQGIVYFGPDVLGWRTIVKAWLRNRSNREAQTLMKYFEKIMDQVVDYIVIKVG